MFSFILQDYSEVVDAAKNNLEVQKLVLGEDGVDSEWVKDLASKLPPEFEEKMLQLLTED